jgi:hypothetical protein
MPYLSNKYTDSTTEHSITVLCLEMAHIGRIHEPEGRELYGWLPVVPWPHQDLGSASPNADDRLLEIRSNLLHNVF